MKDSVKKARRFFTLSLCSFVAASTASFAAAVNGIPDGVYFADDAENVLVAGGLFKAAFSENAAAVTAGASFETPLDGAPEDDALGTVSVSLLGVPLKEVAVSRLPASEVVPYGKIVGVRINTAGVLVLKIGTVETGAAGGGKKPAEGKLREGDFIVKVNGIELTDKTAFSKVVEKGETFTATVNRDGAAVSVELTPVKASDGIFRVGVYVRDGTQGIGTITYVNPQTKAYGALGHGILDVDTKRLMTVRKGELTEGGEVSVRKGKKGSPGELEGMVGALSNRPLGVIESNTSLGLYGHLNAVPSGQPLKVAAQSEVKEGPAKILSDVAGGGIREYDVFIESVSRRNSDDGKSMVVRITDPALLERTNGIVQGMSGSPIIQNNMLVGAVTHVFVQNPGKGYGVFIESMIKQERKGRAVM